VVYIEVVMTSLDPTGSSMYLALRDFYPMVIPSMEFVSNVFNAFEKDTGFDSNISFRTPWATQLEKWLPSNVGLLRDPVDVNWDKFRVVDEKLYTFALLRYS
jgi:hypothetical protein